MDPLRQYRDDVKKEHAAGKVTEGSYRPAVKALVENLGDGLHAINEPKHADYGAPDFIVERNGALVGHIECKDIGANLDAEQESEQLQRYRNALPNLVLTDQCQFRWYTNGELRETAHLGRFGQNATWVSQPKGEANVRELLISFFAASTPATDNPADLAQRMAGKTRLLRDSIQRILQQEDDSSALTELLTSYRQVLISGLDMEEFADMQAQTAAYGMFAARVLWQGKGDFTRQDAVFAQTAPFLRDVFGRIAGPSADPRISWILDDFARLLAQADMSAMLDDFGRRTRQQDPVFHFYEDFLAAYDPGERERRGVYYTPEPVVSYIVRSIDRLLRREFGLADGLADTTTIPSEEGQNPRVLILDPAAGTGTFLREAITTIRLTIEEKGLGGGWSTYVRDHLLQRLFGFELKMAPYVICHLKLAREIGGEPEEFQMPLGERLNVFLTNSLEAVHEGATGPMFGYEIAREAREADAVKREKPVMVVLGNPPYSGQSANKGQWIRDLLRGKVEGSPESYFEVDGGPLGERNPQWLNDDYVKFIRFAQWRIERTGEGVLGFVTNHSYLDNPTFRGMRQSLMAAFDEIYLLDLHGNSRKQERPPGGGPDQNVFDIQQGVAIGLFIKHKSGEGPARVFHADLWGEREAGSEGGKYHWLTTNDIETTEWAELVPESPHYLFIPRDTASLAEYQVGWDLTSILPVRSSGIVTARDKLTLQWTADEMRRVASEFTALSEESARERFSLGKDAEEWKVASAQEDIRTHPDADRHIAPILYRPFDTRFTYYTGRSRGFACRPRKDVMRHLLRRANFGLICSRIQPIEGTWSFCGITREVAGVRAFANGARGISTVFPLYIYPPDEDPLGLSSAQRTPNLAPEFVDALGQMTGLTFTPDGMGDLKTAFGPEDVFHYIYAVLHSPEYRRRYADFLKSDFPRIPLPGACDLFAELVGLGKYLTSLHLMEAEGKDKPAYPVSDGNKVESVQYTQPASGIPGRVWINKTQYFEGVAPETWEFTIGGYQPAKKWLEDRKPRKGRKGHILSFDDIVWYQRICAALAATPRAMERIDEVIAEQGGWPLGG